MSVQVEPYGNDPILLTAFTGTVTFDDFATMYRLCDTYLAQTGEPFAWRVMDISKAEVSFPVIMELFRKFEAQTPGGFADRRIRSVFAHPHPMASLIRDLLAKETGGRIEITVYPGIGEALMFAQEALYEQGAAGSGA